MSAEVRTIRRDPRVALTIDVQAQPSRALLLRGRAEIDVGPGMEIELFLLNPEPSETVESPAA
jgi:hypothetical protein